MCLSGKVQVQPLETKLSPMTIGVAGVELGGGEDGFPGGGGGSHGDGAGSVGHGSGGNNLVAGVGDVGDDGGRSSSS